MLLVNGYRELPISSEHTIAVIGEGNEDRVAHFHRAYAAVVN